MLKYRTQQKTPKPAAFQGIDHILDCDRLPVVERHAFPQGEGVRFSVLGKNIVTGDGRDDRAVGAGLHQPLEDVELDLTDPRRGGSVGVEVVQILCDTYRD